MRRAPSSVLGLLLLVGLQAPAAENDAAPLESTKKELRQLESAQKDKSGSTPAGSVKLSTPSMEFQTTETQVLKQWSDEKKKTEKKQRATQSDADNWLVNGVERLSKEGAGDSTDKSDGEQEDDPLAMRDPADPQSLLKTFDQQKRHADTKAAAPRSQSAPVADPFAPFLQNWLGTSPVKDQVVAQFRKGAEPSGLGAAGGPADFLSPAPAGSPASGLATKAPAVEAKPNPYLAGLDTPLSTPAPGSNGGVNPLPALDRIPAPPGPALAPALVPLLELPPEVRPPAKGPPPGWTDDKKYFPQQKKF